MSKNTEQLIDGVPVRIDNDPFLNYETDTVFSSRIFGRLIAFVLNNIPSSVGNFLINATTKKGREVKDRATTYHALDMLYTSGNFSSKDGIIKGIIDYFWFQLGNPRAVRNRLKLVKKIFTETLTKEMNNDIKSLFCIFILGCGSSRAIIETLHNLRSSGFNLNTLNVKLLDKDPEALALSQEIISRHNIEKKYFSFIEDKIKNFEKHLDINSVKVIEMVGVTDYLDDDDAVEIFKKIYKTLSLRGIFITANIKVNKEIKFVTNVVKWKMVYREPKDLIRLLSAAGFEKSKMRIILEPLKTHIVAVCEK